MLPSDAHVLECLTTVKESVQWLLHHPTPELIFMDIQLADDLSFAIFRQVSITAPVIFTTAYDEHVLQAQEHSAVDYLLEPVRQERLDKALEKVRNLENHFLQRHLPGLLDQWKTRIAQKRYLAKKGGIFVPIAVEQVAYFFTEHKLVFLCDQQGRCYIIDRTLKGLASELLPFRFFRVNRKYLVQVDAIQTFSTDEGKIVLKLAPKAPG